MIWPGHVKLLSEGQFVVYILEENGLHTMSVEGDAEFYADDDID